MKDHIRICVTCRYRQEQCAGACVCQLDGQEILEHARQGYCPAGRYQLGIGDWMARLTHRTGLRRLVALWERRTGRSCGCTERQGRANRRFAGLWEWLEDWRDLLRAGESAGA